MPERRRGVTDKPDGWPDKDDWALIFTSLDFTEDAFRKHRYPSYEVQCERIEQVNRARGRLRALRDHLREKGLER